MRTAIAPLEYRARPFSTALCTSGVSWRTSLSDQSPRLLKHMDGQFGLYSSERIARYTNLTCSGPGVYRISSRRCKTSSLCSSSSYSTRSSSSQYWHFWRENRGRWLSARHALNQAGCMTKNKITNLTLSHGGKMNTRPSPAAFSDLKGTCLTWPINHPTITSSNIIRL